jgi:hypothetical protein
VANLLFHGRRLTTSRTGAAEQFAAEREAVLALIRDLGPEDGARPVLIPRLRGLEDSSRNWSVYMTLEHLRIVHGGAAQIIGLLAQGKIPPRAVSTAAVKPASGIDASVIPAFNASCTALAQTVAAIPDLRSSVRHAHPWFGPLDAAGWHFLAGFHLRLHRRQIADIIARL